jgi:hypothetical protein
MNHTSSPANEHNQAAVIFTAILTVVAGGAGLAMAGLILGVDYLLHGDPDERGHRAAQRAQARRDRYADALAWLAADRADRARHRQQVRDWFEADPNGRGDRPTSGETVGRAAARAWYGLVVGTVRFRRGWRDGRDEARQRRHDGEKGWWRPGRDGGGPAPTDNQPPPVPAGDEPAPVPPSQPSSSPATGQTTKPDDNIIDAEIVADDPRPAPGQDLIPAADDETIPTSNIDGYDRRITALQDEVDSHRRTSGHDDPSPSLR